jgi:hypothetical protein
MHIFSWLILSSYVLFISASTSAQELDIEEVAQLGIPNISSVINLNNFAIGYSTQGPVIHVFTKKDSSWSHLERYNRYNEYPIKHGLQKLSENSVGYVTRRGKLVKFNVNNEGVIIVTETLLEIPNPGLGEQYAYTSAFKVFNEHLFVISLAPSKLFIFNLSDNLKLVSSFTPDISNPIKRLSISEGKIWLTLDKAIMELSVQDQFSNIKLNNLYQFFDNKIIKDIAVNETKIIAIVAETDFYQEGDGKEYYYFEFDSKNKKFTKSTSQYGIAKLFHLKDDNFLMYGTDGKLAFIDFADPSSPIVSLLDGSSAYVDIYDIAEPFISEDKITIPMENSSFKILDLELKELSKFTPEVSELFITTVTEEYLIASVANIGAIKLPIQSIIEFAAGNTNTFPSMETTLLDARCFLQYGDALWAPYHTFFRRHDLNENTPPSQIDLSWFHGLGVFYSSICAQEDNTLFFAGGGDIAYFDVDDSGSPGLFRALDARNIYESDLGMSYSYPNANSIRAMVFNGEQLYLNIDKALLVFDFDREAMTLSLSQAINIQEILDLAFPDFDEMTPHVNSIIWHDEYLFVADSNLGSIYRFQLEGSILTFVDIINGVDLGRVWDGNKSNGSPMFSLRNIRIWRDHLISHAGNKIALYTLTNEGTITSKEFELPDEVFNIHIIGDLIVATLFDNTAKIYKITYIAESFTIQVQEDINKQGLLDSSHDFTNAVILPKSYNGGLSIDGSNFAYTPNPEFSGNDRYLISSNQENGLETTIELEFSVASINDKPLLLQESYVTDEDVAVIFNLNAFDKEGHQISFSVDDDSTLNGTVSVSNEGEMNFTPEQDFNGDTAFILGLADSEDEYSQYQVKLTIDPINDKPIANNSSFSIMANKILESQLLFSDIDSTNLLLEITDTTKNGSLELKEDGKFVYSPNKDFVGQDTFSFSVKDQEGLISTANVSINIASFATEVNKKGGGSIGYLYLLLFIASFAKIFCHRCRLKPKYIINSLEVL